MKKKLFAVVLAATMLMSSLTVSATELTNIEPGGSTAVEADILGAGEVTYIIAIPEKIDFGTLVMPKNTEVEHSKTVGFEVSAVEIIGLDTSTSRVVVLLKDAVAQGGKFQIAGISGTNNGKVLEYSVLNSGGVNLTTGTEEYPNGYAFAAFSQADQSVNGSLRLDQNQLFGEDIAEWAGDYLGTINFYTTIVGIDDIS